jgi:hypothetical protein
MHAEQRLGCLAIKTAKGSSSVSGSDPSPSRRRAANFWYPGTCRAAAVPTPTIVT